MHARYLTCILSILNLYWLQHVCSVRGMYECLRTVKFIRQYCLKMDNIPGPWHLALDVLSSFVSLVWCTDFHTFHGDQRNSCHTMGDKTRQEAGSWVLSPALMVSELSWWRYFFKMSDLIAESGPWYFQVCQGHSALWMPQMPFQLRVLALISEHPPSCDKCLLRIWLLRDHPLGCLPCFLHFVWMQLLANLLNLFECILYSISSSMIDHQSCIIFV